MRILLPFVLLAGSAFGQRAILSYDPTGAGNPMPVWEKYTVTAIANGVNGCANAAGCWQVNGVLGAIKAAATTQDVTLFQLPANGFVGALRIKTAVAFTGTTTLVGTLGTATNNIFYISSAYNLKAAVSSTNFAPTTGLSVGLGSTTAAAVNVVLGLTSTIDNVDQITTGSSVAVWVMTGILP